MFERHPLRRCIGKRIVARIDQLMALCDALEQNISDATDKQTELLHAVMAQV